ncbi:MAG: CoA transferase [Acidimicrobiia bacterium]|nr:CoA transferase [Acidimicrobiia bacterium]
MHGITVLDLSRDIAGGFCGRLLAVMGADVERREPLGGHPLRGAEPLLADGRSALHDYLAAPEHLADTPAPAVDDTAALVDAAAGFDVVVLSADGDTDTIGRAAAALRAAHPGLVVVVSSPFGLTGPWAGYRGGPLVDWASGGHMSLNGEPDREPIPAGGPWNSTLVGAVAAMGAQAALARARRSGRGDLVDVAAMHTLACMHQWSIVLYAHQGVVKGRYGNRHGEAHHPLALFPTADGWVCIASVTRPQWEGLCIAMDHPELLADDSLYAPAARFDRADELDALINPWTSSLPGAEVVRILQESFCPAAAVRSMDELLASQHLAQRGYWQPLATGPDPERERIPGPPFRVTSHPVEPDRADDAARLASATPLASRGPAELALAGVRVIEFSVAWAGPLAGRTLAELGADVIKIEHPTSRGLSVSPGGAADEAWEWGTLPGPQHRNGTYPNGLPGERWWNQLGYFNKVNRSKRSLCLDVKAPGGREILDELVRRADVVLDNYSPRGVRSLGIDHESLRRLNPRIVSVDLSGFGATGPDAEQVSWGPILDATSGLAHASGYADSGPYKQGLAFADAVGGVHGACAVLAALHERDRTGGSVHVDVSQLETLIGMAGELALVTSASGTPPARHGARSTVFAPQGVYPADGEDRWIAVSVTDDAEWAALVGVIGGSLDRPAWAAGVQARRADHDAIDEAIAGWTSARDPFVAMATMQAAGVRASVVMDNRDLVESEQLSHRGFLVTLEHDDCPPLPFPGFPLRFAEAATDVRATPALGAHNREILAELGYDDAALSVLESTGTVAARPPT